MSNPIHDLYHAAMAAERAYSDELARLYGNAAGDARYDARGIATPELLALYTEKHSSFQAYRVAAWPHARAA